MDRSFEGRRLCVWQQFAALGSRLIGVRRNHGVWLDEFIDHISCFRGTGREDVANIQNSQLGVEFTSDNTVLIRYHTGIAGEIDRESVGKAEYIPARWSDIGGSSRWPASPWPDRR